MNCALSPLFRPLNIRALQVPNRIVMAPMTRAHSPNGVPGADVADYYRRRAEGGTGLIVTEGVAIGHQTSVDSPSVPRLHGRDALDGWRRVVDAVHEAGGKIVPQLWHVGPLWGAMGPVEPGLKPMRPSGVWGTMGTTSYPDDYVRRALEPTAPMSEADIVEVIEAYATAAENARALGFDGVAIHGGHGYLLDAFLWRSTNTRDDAWGGDLVRRTAFPAAVVAAIREQVGPDLPIVFRFSQHKQQDYTARIAEDPAELAIILRALVDAGADVLDASSRRFDIPAFGESDLSLAGWAKKLTGATTMAVGSVGLGKSLRESRIDGEATSHDNIPELERRMAAGEFDLIAIGRLHLADPRLASTLRQRTELPSYNRAVHEAVLT
ncbi:NADH:flavin oxidoreductase [Nocardia sp. NPDC059228]|uniref:NADH:flavin oxidoreductase n=1 Tax=Nocardia sp. NPDC059228 TaxID=3346777 RepID=UPI0036904830